MVGRTLWCKALLVSTFFLFEKSSLRAEERQRIDPARDEARVVHVENGWALWRTSTPVEEFKGARIALATHRFYRQRLTEKEATYAFEKVGGAGWGSSLVAIEPSGVIVFAEGYFISWCDMEGKIESTEEIHSGMFRRVYADGVVVQAGSTTSSDGKSVEAAAAYFLPFKGKAFDHKNQWKIAAAGVKSLSYSEPARHGDTLTWMADNHLHFANLMARKRSKVAVEDRNKTELNLRNTSVTAFDGETILLGSNVVVDCKTGKRIATIWNDDRINYLFATRRRIGYRLIENTIDAVDLLDATRAPKFIEKTETRHIFPTSDGLVWWTGTAWKTQPWLQSFPAE